MKTDGFGITHNPNCHHPEWRTHRAHKNRHNSHIQKCRCGVIWEKGDAALTPRSINYTK